MVRRDPLDGERNDALRPVVGLLDRLLLEAPDDPCSVHARLGLHCPHELALRLLRRQTGDPLERRPLLGYPGGYRILLESHRNLAIVEGLRAGVELVRSLVHGQGARVHGQSVLLEPLLLAQQLLAVLPRLTLELAARLQQLLARLDRRISDQLLSFLLRDRDDPSVLPLRRCPESICLRRRAAKPLTTEDRDSPGGEEHNHSASDEYHRAVHFVPLSRNKGYGPRMPMQRRELRPPHSAV